MQIEYYHDRYGRMHEYDWDKTLDLIKTLLKDGKNLKKIFTRIEHIDNGLIKVEIFNKVNIIIPRNREFLFDMWYNYIGDFVNGFARVKLNNKWNFINIEGELMFDEWANKITVFRNGYAIIQMGDKWNLMTVNYQFVFNEWFDGLETFKEGFAPIKIGDKWTFINFDEMKISNERYDSVGKFVNGLAPVKIGDKWAFINYNGEKINNDLYDGVGQFYLGYSKVRLNNKFNFINQEGDYLSDDWYDFAGSFRCGRVPVKLGQKWNYLTKEGEYLSNIWFDYADRFKNSKAYVKIGGKGYIINRYGELFDLKGNAIEQIDNLQENINNKKIIISETQEKILAQLLKEGIYQMPVDKKMNKPYCVNPEKVLIVKKFLDKGFSAHDYEKIGSNGLPCKIKVFSMNASNGEPLKYMYQDQLQDLLIDRFQNMFSDKIERELFMAQVIKDWVAGKIGIFGSLSTNRLLAENMTSEEIDERANEANTNPTDKQKEASNYKMGHVIVQGMPISIENPKGSKRFWKDEKGNEGHVIMKNHYGYFKKTSGNGKDGDAVDVFIGPNPEEAVTVYVVDQNNKSGEFDESKVMLGFKSITDAKEAYLSNYSKDWKGFRDITGVGILTFKRWLYRKRKQRKPFADYVMIQKKKLE